MNLLDLIELLNGAHAEHGNLPTFIGEDILTTISIEYDKDDNPTCLVLESDESDGEEIH